MSTIHSEFKNLIPSYPEVFKISLFERFANVGGANQLTSQSSGKYFESYYEFYIYAYFMGLYLGYPTELSGKKTSFRLEIGQWGNKSTKIHRKEFVKIQDYIFMSAFTKAKLDPISIEKGEITQEQVLSTLKTTIENYTNSGLLYIDENVESIKLGISQYSFLNLILKLNKAASAP